MCTLETSWEHEEDQFEELPLVLEHLEEMELDGLIDTNTKKVSVTELGRPFVRNVCMAFDLLLHRKAPEKRIFSMTI
jgi:oxygen-independent coproporphyrinogen-3 oxidase